MKARRPVVGQALDLLEDCRVGQGRQSRRCGAACATSRAGTTAAARCRSLRGANAPAESATTPAAANASPYFAVAAKRTMPIARSSIRIARAPRPAVVTPELAERRGELVKKLQGCQQQKS